jgi:peroxiredoxin-like protein
MSKSYSYQASARWTSHQRGIAESQSIPRTINFAAPPEFGGEPGLWTPEHLLLASLATCFVCTLRAVADASNLEIDAVEVPIDGSIEKLEGGFKFTRINLRPVLTIHRKEDRERAGRLLEKAERLCLISRSLNCTIVLEPKIQVEALAVSPL